MSEPRQKPYRSKQDFETPPDLLAAVVARFGPLAIDLAARLDNRKAPKHLGPGGLVEDALRADWSRYIDGNAWLNPEFEDIDPWADHCAWTRLRPDDRILLLTPASVGSNWFAKHVHGRALVLALSPRLTFLEAPHVDFAPSLPLFGVNANVEAVPCEDAYPKDCILSVFGEPPGFEPWRWKP